MSNARLAALAAVFVLAAGLPAGATGVERRIAPGAVLKGRVDVKAAPRFGEVRDRYTLKALKGETLTLSLTADRPAILYVWRGDYNAGHVIDGTGAKIEKVVEVKAGGDYVVDVETFNVPAINYTLKVTRRRGS